MRCAGYDDFLLNCCCCS